MSCQIKDYQKAPLNLSSVVPLNAPPISCLQSCQGNGEATGKVLGKGEEERDK